MYFAIDPEYLYIITNKSLIESKYESEIGGMKMHIISKHVVLKEIASCSIVKPSRAGSADESLLTQGAHTHFGGAKDCEFLNDYHTYVLLCIIIVACSLFLPISIYENDKVCHCC